jgi:hypothetical protein
MTDKVKRKTNVAKKGAPKKHAKAGAKKTIKKPLGARIKQKTNAFLSRRPHRSFRVSRRRDYRRSLKMPGYWAFTGRVLSVMKQNKKVLLLLALTYTIFSAVLLGLASQDNFEQLKEDAASVGESLFAGDWGTAGTATVLTISAISGNLSPQLSEVQQIYAVILVLLAWLVVVWILRQRLAGHVVKMRDGLYNAGAPIIPLFVLSVVFVVQLLPIGLAAIGYAAAQSSGLLDGGVEAMLFWAAAAGLAALSLYWLTSTTLAMVIVTLPGMYPFKALKIAGDMVVGRRLRILYRILWMLFILALIWLVVLIPMVSIDLGLKAWIPAIQWVPLVPVTIACLTTYSVIWISSYTYLLYRRIVDDDAKPA